MASRRSHLTLQRILEWADDQHQRTGKWPTSKAGPCRGAQRKTWGQIDEALHQGGGGLPTGWSLAGLLYERRKVRGPKDLFPLTEGMIVRWAEQHKTRTGRWPCAKPEPIPGSGGVSWRGVDFALRNGQRGLRGGTSLARILEHYLGVRGVRRQPKLTQRQILEWADNHRSNTGEWPASKVGHIIGAPEENWRNIDNALRYGLRGLPGGSSLVQLLEKKRGRRNLHALPNLTKAMILKWADAHHRRTGIWPKSYSGAIPSSNALEDTWQRVDIAMIKGARGMPGGSSLADLLAKHGRKRHLHKQPRLSIRKILQWANAHRRRTGRPPLTHGGAIVGVPGERWRNIDNALRYGLRGLPGGSSLSVLLQEHGEKKR